MHECALGDRRIARWRGGTDALCARHFVTSRAIRRRAVATAAVVGTVLVAINQGDALLSGSIAAPMWWKIPLTYLVPYAVTTWGALNGARIPDEAD